VTLLSSLQPGLAGPSGRGAGMAGARLLVSGSAALPVRVFDPLRELTGLAPVERYGMSESLIALSTRADGERRPGWVGQPLPGLHTRLRGEQGVEVAADGESVGELQLRTPSLFDSYLNRPEATAASWTVDGWFDTGDVAVIEPTGFQRIVGRESTNLGERVVAYVVGAELDGLDLSGFVAEALSVAQAPSGGPGRRRPAPERHGQGAEEAPRRARAWLSQYRGGHESRRHGRTGAQGTVRLRHGQGQRDVRRDLR